MRIKVAKTLSSVETIDLLSGYHQIFQGPPPNISSYTVKRSAFDAILVPHDAMHWTKEYGHYVKSLTQESPVIFFNRGDHPRRFSFENAYSVQNTFCINDTKIIIAPYNVMNLGLMSLREYRKTPKISFVGFVPKLLSRRILKFPAGSRLHPFQNNSALVRKFGAYNLKRLFYDSEVVMRNHYGGSTRLVKEPRQFRQVFINAIHNSDLVFAPRGDANGSQRFFETLSAGRIPIVPETRMRIPFDHTSIPDLTFLNCSTLSFDIFEVVMTWWSQLNNSNFKDIQMKNNKIYNDRLDYRRFINALLESETSILNRLAI